MSRADDLFGKNDVEALGSSPLVVSPWRSASGRKDVEDYDSTKVHEAIRSGQKTEKVDPRNLVATQPHLRRDVVRHYMSSDEVYADKHQAGNQTPVVYDRNGQHLILSGHHRAARSLLRGEQFDAIVVHGDFGPPRKTQYA